MPNTNMSGYYLIQFYIYIIKLIIYSFIHSVHVPFDLHTPFMHSPM